MKTVVAIGRATALDSRFNRAGAQPMPGHHVADCRARLGPVKALRRSAALRPRFAGLTALTGTSAEPRLGTYVMAGCSSQSSCARDTNVECGSEMNVSCQSRTSDDLSRRHSSPPACKDSRASDRYEANHVE